MRRNGGDRATESFVRRVATTTSAANDAKIAELLDAEQGFISGFTYATSAAGTPNIISMSGGAAYIPGLGRVVKYAGGTVDVSGLVGTNGTKYMYLREDTSTGDGVVNVGVNPPTEPYYGTARENSNIPNRRYLGPVQVYGGACGLFDFINNYYVYWDNLDLRTVVSNGSATTNTGFSVGPYADVTGIHRSVEIEVLTLYGTAGHTTNVSTTAAAAPGAGEGVLRAAVVAASTRARSRGWLRTNLAGSLRYANSAAGGTTNIYVTGFMVER